MVKNVTELALQASSKTLFVLDIDSSLVLTHKRNEAILRHFAQSIRLKNPELSELMAKSECFPMEYGYFAALERVAPHMSPIDKEALHAFWKMHFFSNDFLHFDTLHEGAIDFVQTLHRLALPFVYLTGRPSDKMRPGTLAVLDKVGFPITDKQLFMKPNDSFIDEHFKKDILKEIMRGFETVFFIDNEPRVLLQIEKFYPHVHLVFVDTCHSPNVKAPDSALTIKNFIAINTELHKKKSVPQ